jgi:Peptidase M60, enhancin and enhancin-like
MSKIIFTLFLIFAFLFAANAQNYNNYQKEYVLRSVTEARIEADRTHRMLLCDYQPSGLYVKKGEKLVLSVGMLNREYKLSSMIGFKPMWGNRNKAQENELKEGANTVIANQEGILSFIFVKKEGYDTNPVTVEVKVTGGKAFPLYKAGRSNPANWANDLKIMTDAPFVQFVSDKALITIPYKDYLKSPTENIEESFKTLHTVINWEDDLAGFDNTTPQNTKTNNRIHFAVDMFSTPKESEDYYMYASNYLIGMKPDNFTDQTKNLNKSWGIWHEIGHTHQQRSWTWDSIGEISVNIFSLYVQENFGLPSRLNSNEDDANETPFSKAKKYLARSDKDYLKENKEDYSEFFTKLVMFHQLRSAYGWNAFKKLHQDFRVKPYVDEEETDQDKANKFIYEMCFLTKNNLVPFFGKWGLKVDEKTVKKINALNVKLPAVDPSKNFQ